MNRRTLLAHLGGAIGVGLAGCTEIFEDNGTRTDAPTPEVPTVGNITAVPDPENITVENVTVESPSIENITVEMPTIDEPTDNATVPDVEFCSDHDDIAVVNHSLVAMAEETYYVEGSVQNEGPDTTCSFVLLEVEYPNDRRERDSMFVGNLDPAATGHFILGPLNLTDVNPDDVGYNIYVTNESWDDE